ncbi:MAG: flagellar basal body P-ring formation chaperone FlgA [Opitutae bacterium]
MKAICSFCLFVVLSGVGFAGVERFLKPLKINPQEQIFPTQTNALIRGPFSIDRSRTVLGDHTKEVVTSQRLEKLLAESIQYRFQASGEIVVNLTSSWNPVEIQSNFVLKLADISPDELSASCFVRFSLWESGAKVGDFALPIRVAQMRDVYVTARSIPFGAKLTKEDFKLQRVDVLKQHANSVPSTTNLSSFQLDSYMSANTPLKWSNISKANLIKKGQVIDVFASGNGIYVTMKGLALEDGAMDSVVRVRNLSSEKEFHAKVLSENSVKVSL